MRGVKVEDAVHLFTAVTRPRILETTTRTAVAVEVEEVVSTTTSTPGTTLILLICGNCSTVADRLAMIVEITSIKVEVEAVAEAGIEEAVVGVEVEEAVVGVEVLPESGKKSREK